MTEGSPTNSANFLKERLFAIGNQSKPQAIEHWFFRYFSKGLDALGKESRELLYNYHALFLRAIKVIQHLYPNVRFIRDTQDQQTTWYFVGDTHGSFQDTYTLINYFVQLFQITSNVKIVWIGDMVDRNPSDLQNLALIVAFWLTFPEKIYIIRGNHEDASVCSRYGFSQHLFDYAGDREYFLHLWETLMAFFSSLPLGLITRIGEKNILVVHGGIPFDPNNYYPVRLEDIESQLNCFVPEHFDMDPYSQTILWGDPDPHLETGVSPTPRTGRPRFSRQAFESFLALNNLHMIIRGHEKFNTGYNLLWENRFVTLFSTSTYDNQPIGLAKFLRLTQAQQIINLGDEREATGHGILAVENTFLSQLLSKM